MCLFSTLNLSPLNPLAVVLCEFDEMFRVQFGILRVMISEQNTEGFGK